MNRPLVSELNDAKRVASMVLDAARSGHAIRLDATEQSAIERLIRFAEPPTAREIDTIVDRYNLDQHSAERAIRAIWVGA